MDKLTMNVSEMAEHLNISMPTAYELIKQQDFPVIHIGKRAVIPVAAFQEWLNTSVGRR